MLKKSLLTIALLLTAAVSAQTPSTPAKKELVGRILKLQQPGIEAMARGLAEQPAIDLMDRAAVALTSSVAPDKREAVAKDIQADVKKYVDDTVPLVRDRAIKLAPTTIGPLLEEKFSEDELKQLVGMIESPTYIRFQLLGTDMQKVLTEKLVTETRGTVEPKVRSLEQSIAKRLGLPAQPAAAPAARAPAKPATK
jgi:hypothetical protein